MEIQKIFADILLVLSLLVLATGTAFVFWPYKFKSKYKPRRYFAFVMLLFAAVFLLSCAVAIGGSDDKSTPKNWFAAFIGIASYTVQLFTINASFYDIVEAGAAFFDPGFKTLFAASITIYTVLVPAAGGFVVFNLFGALVPKFKLAMLTAKRTRYVFSQPNERSLALAEDLAERAYYAKRAKKEDREDKNKEEFWLCSSVIIFTDAGGASEELISRAKKIGAVCLNESVAELNLRFSKLSKNKKAVYFLIDDDSANNLDYAVSLLSDKRGLWKRTVTDRANLNTRVKNGKTDRADIFVYAENPEAAGIVERTFYLNCERIGTISKGEKTVAVADCDKNIRIKTVNEYRNLAYRMFAGYEDGGVLFDHLSNDGERLNIVLIGSGKIGVEFLKTAAWCSLMLVPNRTEPVGQGYKTVDVNITVLSDNALQIEDELRFNYPHLFDDGAGATVKFCDARFGTDAFNKLFDDMGLENSDYALVALGDDDLNIKAAGWLKRKLASGGAKNVPVLFAIENDSLCKTLKRSEGAEKCVYTVPFGSLKERYRFDSAYMTELEDKALAIDGAYKGGNFVKNRVSNYNFESSVAAALHFAYKLYGIGAYSVDAADALRKYCDRDVKRMYWLEHKRWVNFYYANGYCCPSAKKFLNDGFAKGDVFNSEARRDEDNKMHACLLESGPEYVNINTVFAKYISQLKPSQNAKEEFDRHVKLFLSASGGVDEGRKAFRLSRNFEVIGEKIARYRRQDGGTLSQFLRDCFCDFTDCDGVCLDDLDRLGLFVSIFGDGDLSDFKSYDVDVAGEALIGFAKTEIARICKAGVSEGDKDKLYDLIVAVAQAGKGFGKIAAFKKGVEDAESAVVALETSASDDSALVAVKGLDVNVAKAQKGAFIVELCANKHAILQDNSANTDDKILLVRVPFEGGVCVGTNKNGANVVLKYDTEKSESLPVEAEDFDVVAKPISAKRKLCVRVGD